MRDKEVIRELMKASKISSPKLAEKLNYACNSGVTEKLRRTKAMRVDTFAKFISALDGTLLVRQGENEYEISFDTKPKYNLDALLGEEV